jgi:hypothetical protein
VLYVDANKSVGDADHIKAFASRRAADEWFNDNDPKGVAFEYEVVQRPNSASIVKASPKVSPIIRKLPGLWSVARHAF